MTTTSVGLFRSGITPIERMVQTTVGRKEMLEDVLLKLKNSADKKSIQHYVFIGPRGIGKTHFLTLIENAVYTDELLKERYTIIRFPEENNRILSFADLLLGIVHLLPEKDWSDLYETLSIIEDDQEIIDTIIPRLKDYRKQTGKLLLILLENLDVLLTQQIKNQQDIHRFRTFLMDSPCATLIGTSPSYFPGLYDVKSPLYDFFDIQVLEDLSEEQTIEMIRRNLEWEYRQDILNDFESLVPKIRTIHVMTGGNPRLIMMLNELVANDNILDVKVQFQKLLDQISPFYQDRLKELAPQERALLETIALMRSGPRTPAAIALRLRMQQQQVSSLLQRMTKAGYLTVAANPDDKRSRFYRIKEGFFDLWLAMNESRINKKRLPYLLEMLSRWYQNPKERETKREQLVQKCEEPGCDEKQKKNSLEMLGYLSDIGETDEQFIAKLELAVKNLNQGDYEKSLEYFDEVKPLASVKGVFEWMRIETEKCSEGTAEVDINKWFGNLIEYWKNLRGGYLEKAAGIAHDLGYDLSNKGLHQIRMELLKDAFEHSVDPNQKGSLLVDIAQSLKINGRIDDALESLQKALGLCRERENRKLEGLILNNISQIYHNKGDYDTTLQYLEQSLKNSQEIGDQAGEGVVLNNISQIYDTQGDYNKALKYLEQSLKIRQEIGDHRGEGVTLNNISQIFDAKGDYDTALRYLEQSLKIRQKIGDRLGEGITLNNISQIYHAKGDSDTALRYLERSLKICQEIGDRHGEGCTLNNISLIYHAKGDSDAALRFLEQSMKICQEIGDRHGQIFTLHNMAIVARKKQDVKTFSQHETLAYKIAYEIGDAEGIYQTGQTLGQFLCSTGALNQGLPMLRQAYAIGVKAGYPDVDKVKAIIEKYELKKDS